VHILPWAFPHLFISYRWESGEHEHWMDYFVSDLLDRGYYVVFDRDPRRFGSEIDVDSLLALMNTCQIFVPVITEGYTQRVLAAHPEDGGALRREWDLALHLGEQRKLAFMGIWRSGEFVPPPFTPDALADFRDLSHYPHHMDATFPYRQVTVVGLRTDGNEHAIGPLRREEVRGAVEVLIQNGSFERIEVRPG
jgi:hypothetical protein